MSETLRRAGILGTGSYLPERGLNNCELADRFGCSEEWILSRTGIKERRFSAGASDRAADGPPPSGVLRAYRAVFVDGASPRGYPAKVQTGRRETPSLRDG